MHTLPAHQRQAPLKGVDGQGRVHVQVAKQYACIRVVCRIPLRRLASGHDLAIQRLRSDFTIGLEAASRENDPQPDADQYESQDCSEAPDLEPRHRGGA
jgi:hypothetical protein